MQQLCQIVTCCYLGIFIDRFWW